MAKNIKTVLLVTSAVLVLATGIAGCGGELLTETSTQELDAFVTDRVAEVRLVMKDEDWKSCQTNALAEEYVKADFWFDGELVPDVAVRPKGNSSLWSTFGMGTPRFSFKVDFNLFNSARNFRGLKKLNFNNGFKDPTLIRERLAYELFEQMGLPTARTAFVDLWVNDVHLGLYTQAEQVDLTFLKRHFADSTGNLYKPDGPAAYLNWTEADLEKQRAIMGIDKQDVSIDSQQVNVGGGRLSDILRALQEGEAGDKTILPGQPNIPPITPLPPTDMPTPPGRQPPAGQPMRPPPSWQQLDNIGAMALKTNENTPDHSALFRFLEVLNSEPDETFPAEIEKVLDVDQALRFLAVSALTVHLDNYLGSGHNYYLYEMDGKFTIIPWDLNEAFGTFNVGIDREGIINFLIDEPTAGPVAERPLVKRLLSYQPYRDTYHRYLETLLNGTFSVEVMNSRIDALANMIRPYAEADKFKFYTTEEFERGLSEEVTELPQTGETPSPRPGLNAIGLKAFVVERSASVREQLAGTRPSTANGRGNDSSTGGRMPGGAPPPPLPPPRR